MIPKRAVKWSIAIPAAVTSNAVHLREKTRIIGQIARAAAIYRIDEIVIYPDTPLHHPDQRIEEIATILTFLDTPQYLRKQLFPLTKTLRYSGTLPPLRTPHHPLTKTTKEVQIGEYREGAVIKTRRAITYVNIGLDIPAVLKDVTISPKTRITTQITAVTPEYIEVTLQNREEINIYWGYRVTVSNCPLGVMINQGNYDIAILTSKYGKSINTSTSTLKSRWQRATNVLIVFGSPEEGLQQILGKEKTQIKIPYLTLNTIPQQGVKTIRVEEAIHATLALLNFVYKKGEVKWVEEEQKPLDMGH
jgi:predicted SPOUT superfamily RNA methylase MTH1